jgi:hypothetical protein
MSCINCESSNQGCVLLTYYFMFDRDQLVFHGDLFILHTSNDEKNWKASLLDIHYDLTIIRLRLSR